MVRRTSKAVELIKRGAHSNIVGGSTAKLRRLCARSIDEERKLAKGAPGQWADAGSALHYVMEQAIKLNMSDKAVLSSFIGVEIERDGMGGPVEITEDMLRKKALPALRWFDKAVHLEAEFFIEKKMAFPGIEGAFGTGDVVFDATYMEEPDGQPMECGVVDWKFGDGDIVQAEDNDQMRFYLVAAIHEGLLPPHREEYVAYIYQPAEKLDPSQYASRGVYTAEDLALFREDLQIAIADWESGQARHVPGAHCNKCGGKLVCAAFKNMQASALATDVEGMNTRQLAEWLERIPAMKKFAEEVYAAALRNAQAGLDIPGFGLKPALGNSAWKDEKAAWGALGRLGVDANERTVKKTISPTQALEKLRELGTPEKQIERFKTLHIRRPDKGERLEKLKPGEVSASALDALGTQLRALGH